MYKSVLGQSFQQIVLFHFRGILGTWFLALGSWSLVLSLGPRSLVPSPSFLVLDSWTLVVLGSWSVVPDPLSLVHKILFTGLLGGLL